MDATRVRGWNDVKAMILESYRLIAPKKTLAKLSREPEAGAAVTAKKATTKPAPRSARAKKPNGAEGTMITTANARTITLGHSPDPDDAFMFYALAAGKIETGALRFVHEINDIETLNRRAMAGTIDLTAVSFAAYPYIAADYQLLACGASVGDGYGPLLVGRSRRVALDQATIAIPGERTTAALALRLYAAEVAPGAELRIRIVPFDRIAETVATGAADLGLLIHEGQITYRTSGLEAVADLGRWWSEETGLPLPLGGNAIRRALGAEAITDVARLLRRSIDYALTHRSEALDHAGAFGRGLGAGDTDRFVGMYVNEWTLDLGARGRQAVVLLLERGRAAGLLPEIGEIDFASGDGEGAAGA